MRINLAYQAYQLGLKSHMVDDIHGVGKYMRAVDLESQKRTSANQKRLCNPRNEPIRSAGMRDSRPVLVTKYRGNFCAPQWNFVLAAVIK